MEVQDVYLVDYVRTPFSRARPRSPHRDAFSEIPGVRLVAETLNNLMDVRLNDKIQRSEIDQFIMGCGYQFGDNYAISGRIPLFLAKFPDTTPAFMTERQCGSGMTALHQAFMSIKLGFEDIVIASSFEHQTREPMHNNKHIQLDLAVGNPMSKWYRPDMDFFGAMSMIQTAQKLYELRIDQFTKEDLDKYGVRSHNLAEKYLEKGFFEDEITPILGHKEEDINQDFLVTQDLAIRKGATLEAMQQLKPFSKPGWAGGYSNPMHDRQAYIIKNGGNPMGVITAGNSSPMNAGAATVLLMSKQAMEEKGLTPLAKIVGLGWAGVDPSLMGLGPVPATEKALKQANLTVDDIDFWEINEAFTIVALNAIYELKIKDHEQKVNVRGGSTAIGHPIAATGIRMPGTLARILKEEHARYGVATMCVGGGQGTTVIIENPEMEV